MVQVFYKNSTPTPSHDRKNVRITAENLFKQHIEKKEEKMKLVTLTKPKEVLETHYENPETKEVLASKDIFDEKKVLNELREFIKSNTKEKKEIIESNKIEEISISMIWEASLKVLFELFKIDGNISTNFSSDQIAIIKQLMKSKEFIENNNISIKKEPAVSIKESVHPDYLICLEDGEKVSMLKRYLKKHHKMTPDEYIEKWDLPADYPFVPPNLSKKRRESAERNQSWKSTSKWRKRKDRWTS